MQAEGWPRNPRLSRPRWLPVSDRRGRVPYAGFIIVAVQPIVRMVSLMA